MDPQKTDPDPQQTDRPDPQQTTPQQVLVLLDLELLGLERLKELLTQGLKCGGTLKERASRLLDSGSETGANRPPAAGQDWV
ncbi:hypothetical protein NHX12_018623 [Muraenolepis orangiensis]|uniref:SDE2/SF3A3 SAP domain-containing protein n=1 Tax=Muraenolepis orangiensis TaxID=630683 RepID=A0A9Q0IY58_9TELE|nr:hypothetical protein NHX12_018623 [Muraenolepis orangiensis]